MPLASSKPIAFGNASNFYIAKGNKTSEEITWRGNVQDLVPGSSFNIVYRTGSGDNSHRIINDIGLSYYITNTSSTATEDLYLASIWQIIDDLVIYINGVKIFESSSKSLNLYHRWLQALMEKSDTKDELSSYIAEENGKYLGTYTTAYHDPAIVGDAESSGYYYSSLKFLFPELFKNLDTKFVYEIRLDASVASDQVGRVNFAVGTLGTRVSIKDLSLKIFEQRHATLIQRPVPCLMLKCPKWVQRTFTTPFSAVTTYTVNITRDFPLIKRMKRVFFGFTESSATTHSNAFLMHHDALTGIEYKINGTTKQNFDTQGLIHKHMNNYYKTQHGHHIHFPPGSTGYSQFQWLFFDFIQCSTNAVEKGDKSKVILGGRNSKSNTHEFVLTLPATDANASLVVIVESDQLIEIKPDQTVHILDS